MRVKLLHHAAEWLPGDFEAPEPQSGRECLTAWRIHHDPGSGLVGMKLTGGAGIWRPSGELLHYVERGADVSWCRDMPDWLSLENRFRPCQRTQGVGHALRWLDHGSFQTLDEMEVCVPTGGVEYLVLSHQNHLALATWLDQTEWGYVIVDLGAKEQWPGGLLWPSASLVPPEFSPDDQLVVACNRIRSGWWNDAEDDSWESPSPGGLRVAGAVTVHEVASGTISRHDVLIELPPGWMPERPDRPDWDTIWGPEFVSEREFLIWLPDDTPEVLALPLLPRVKIRRGLRTRREQWSE